MIVAGVGFRTQCQAAEIVALVRDAMQRAGIQSIAGLATATFKHDAACLHEAASSLAVPILFFSAEALQAAGRNCVTSQRDGRPSLAEAACLAATGGRLLLPRLTSAHASCALATA
jgi:cobalt-precorrin 5A hydrolase